MKSFTVQLLLIILQTIGVCSFSTTTAPPKTDTFRRTKTNRRTRSPYDFTTELPPTGSGPLEYLADDTTQTRLPDDPFHILLMGAETYAKPRITVPYVITSLTYVLGMPDSVAETHAKFAAQNGMSCLGTWPREECLKLGGQLQVRDLECRVVPFCEGGGGGGWQAKDISNNKDVPMFE